MGLWADNNQSDFGDSAPFPLDTTDQATYGMGDSNGFPLDTGGEDGTVKSGSGMSPSPGFRLDTRSNPASVDFNQSGIGEFGSFTLDTGGPPSIYENNQSDFNDSGGFELDTNDPILSGFSDSQGFPLDTGGENGEIKTDSGDSVGFPLDTRDSGSNGNLAQFDFNDSNGFPLDTGGSSGSAPNQAPAFHSDGNFSIPENRRPSYSTSTQPIRTEPPSPIPLLTATTLTSSKSFPPPGCLHSILLPTSSHRQTATRTTVTRLPSGFPTATLRSPSTFKSS